MSNTNELTHAPIAGLVRKIAIPSSMGFFFQTLFNATDTFFVGEIGTQAQAALALSFPVFFIIISIGSGLQTGATACIGNALGAEQDDKARTLITQTFVMAVLAGAVISFLGLLSAPTLYRLLGAQGSYLTDCLTYMTPLFCGAVLFSLLFMENAILIALGDTASFRNVLMLGALVNVILDPVFIHGKMGLPAMGIAGVAYATLIVQAIGIIYLAWRIRKKGILCNLSVREFFPQAAALGEIARQGLPAAGSTATVGIGIFVITYFISWFGPAPVAAYGIAIRIEQLVLLPTIGLNVATLTLVAQNYGARQAQRVIQTLRTALLYGAGIAVIAFAILITVPEPLMRIFTQDTAVITEGVRYLRIAAFMVYSYVLLYVHVSALQGVKRPGFALFMGLARQILFPCAVFWAGIRLLDMGIWAIWWGIFGVTWAAALFSAWYGRRLLHATLEKS